MVVIQLFIGYALNGFILKNTSMQLPGNKCIIVFPVILPIRCRGYIVFLRINFIYSIHRQIDMFISMVKK